MRWAVKKQIRGCRTLPATRVGFRNEWPQKQVSANPSRSATCRTWWPTSPPGSGLSWRTWRARRTGPTPPEKRADDRSARTFTVVAVAVDQANVGVVAQKAGQRVADARDRAVLAEIWRRKRQRRPWWPTWRKTRLSTACPRRGSSATTPHEEASHRVMRKAGRVRPTGNGGPFESKP